MKKKKLLSMLLVLAMVLSLMPAVSIPAKAANASDFSTLKTNLENGYDVTLYGDITISSTITVTGNVILNLNGHTLRRDTTKNHAFEVKGTLTVRNTSSTSSGITGHSIASSRTDESGYGSIFYVNGGTLKLNTGSAGDRQIILERNRHDNGGAVSAANGGKVNMYDNVTITNCQAEGGNSINKGGAIYLDGTNGSCTFSMYGGTIENCSAANGGGVYLYKSTFTMSGGTITNCTANRETEYRGGAVYLYGGTFNMQGGTISDCSAHESGGVFVDQSGKMKMTGGTLSGNKATSDWDEKATSIMAMWGGTAEIDGGYIAADGSSSLPAVNYGDSESITITSGRFSFDNTYIYKYNGNKQTNLTGRTCNITLDGNGGSNSNTTATWNSNLSPVTPPTRTGYKFLGYFTAKEGGEQYYNADGSAYSASGRGTKCDYVGSATLYAHWELAPCTVTLNPNNGTGGTGSVTAYNGSAMPTSGVTMPTRTGYTFAGYYDNTTGGTQYYTAAGASARAWNKTGTAATL